MSSTNSRPIQNSVIILETLKFMNCSYFAKIMTKKPNIGNLTKVTELHPFLESKKWYLLFKGVLWWRVTDVTSHENQELVSRKLFLKMKYWHWTTYPHNPTIHRRLVRPRKEEGLGRWKADLWRQVWRTWRPAHWGWFERARGLLACHSTGSW